MVGLEDLADPRRRVLREVDRGAQTRAGRPRSSPPRSPGGCPTTIVLMPYWPRRGNHPSVDELSSSTWEMKVQASPISERTIAALISDRGERGGRRGRAARSARCASAACRPPGHRSVTCGGWLRPMSGHPISWSSVLGYDPRQAGWRTVGPTGCVAGRTGPRNALLRRSRGPGWTGNDQAAPVVMDSQRSWVSVELSSDAGRRSRRRTPRRSRRRGRSRRSR